MHDVFERPLRNLRVSVTDRCNLRCAYCMPEDEYVWLQTQDILSFEEISSLADDFIALGVDAIRLTGGEPLMRRELPSLIAMLAAKPALRDLSMTTNGLLLTEHAQALKEAGLHRVTISLDTLSPSTFAALTRRSTHQAVLDGIAAAHHAAFSKGLKIDTVVMRGTNDHELIALLDFAARFEAEVRFIEYMDVGGATKWSKHEVVSRGEMLARLSAKLGSIEPLAERTSAPAQRFRLTDGRTFGIIASTTSPFCGRCDRARLTADGRFFTCLYATEGLDLKTPLRAGKIVSPLLRTTWAGRSDRGAEDRLALGESRGPLVSASALRGEPHLEMHTRGG